MSGIDVVQAKAAKRENLLDNTKLLMKKYWPRYLPLLSVGSTLVLEATRLVLTTDSAASPLLSGVRLKEAVELTVIGSSGPGPGSFSPHDGQNLNSGCNFIPH